MPPAMRYLKLQQYLRGISHATALQMEVGPHNWGKKDDSQLGMATIISLKGCLKSATLRMVDSKVFHS